ncbi:MAG: hypothetical protein AB1916_01280 [Thermodesulfobacteriota bacterium]
MTAPLFADAPRTGRVLFRVDAGRLPGLSFGHLERCHVLAEQLRAEHGSDIALLMRPLADGLARARALGERVALPEEWPALLAAADILVMDLPYDPEPEILDAARRAGAFLALLDDTGRDLFPCDAVLNSSLLANPAMYPRARHTLLGPEHFILGPGFAGLRHRGSGDGGPALVLFSFGGSDPAGLTLRTLHALDGLAPFPACRLQVVLGPGFGPTDEVEAALAALPAPGEILRAPRDVAPLFAGCDLAVCAGGRTLYELHALGTPTLALASAPHEEQQVEAFAQRGLIAGGLTCWNDKTFAALFSAQFGRPS